METFPASYSTLSSVALTPYIEKTYGLNDCTCRLLTRNVSDTYLAAAEGRKYIFRVYRKSYRTLEQIKGEVQLLGILKSRNVGVSYPIADLQGNNIQQFEAAEGTRYGVLFSFAEGVAVINPDDHQLELIGKGIAEMHQVTASCVLHHERPVYDFATTLDEPLRIVRHRFAELPDEYQFLAGLAIKIKNKLVDLGIDYFSYGYCHYDLLPKNFHFNGDQITFFDFDWMGKGVLVNDLMTFKVQLFFLAHMGIISREAADGKLEVVIESYRRYRTLSDAEIAAIPALGAMFWIFALGFYEQNFEDFSLNFFTPRFIKERVELIRKWADWYGPLNGSNLT